MDLGGLSYRDLFTALCFLLFFRQEAGVDLEGTFVQRLVYDDSVSYDLVTAAEKVLGKLAYYSQIRKPLSVFFFDNYETRRAKRFLII